MIREAKLAGFVILLAAIFFGAHMAGAHLGPVTTTHAQVSYQGTGGGMGGMNMGGMNMGGMNMGGSGGGHQVTPAAGRGGRR